MIFSPLGDSAVAVTWRERDVPDVASEVAALSAALMQMKAAGITDVVPAFASVAVFYEPAEFVGEGGTAFERVCAVITEQVGRAQLTGGGGEQKTPRTMEIPVRYGGEHGPDLDFVAAHTGLTKEDVVARHSGVDYCVRAIGFAPGFPYLSGLPAELATPRRVSPRASVPAGAVGIGGAQTGVYPLASPGGWQVIGRTEVKLFDPERDEPALLRVGDMVRFRDVSGADASGAVKQRSAQTRDAMATAREPETDASGGLRIVNAGLVTTVQDLGRRGQRAAGVPVGGAMDAFAARLANLLVGNDEGAAVLEMTLLGPEIEFLSATWIAVGGAEFAGCVSWRPVRVEAGRRIKFGAALKGCRGYLAVAGGIAVPAILGSRSTYVRAALGGWRGRALRSGDVLPVTSVVRVVAENWSMDRRILPEYGAAPTVRVILGAQAEEFGREWLGWEFKVTPQSDRMGMRLAGTPVTRTGGAELLSTAVAPGTVQVPPDGQPIVLMADAQTIGGYPQLAHVISADLPLLAQLRPGDSVRFQVASLGDAHQLGLAREYALAMLREGLAQKFG